MTIVVPTAVDATTAEAEDFNDLAAIVQQFANLVEEWNSPLADYVDAHPSSAKTWYSTGTQPSIGSGQQTFRWGKRPGKIIRVEWGITFAGDTNAGSGDFRFRMPNSITQRSISNASSVSGPRGDAYAIHGGNNYMTMKCQVFASDYFTVGFGSPTGTLGASNTPWSGTFSSGDWLGGWLEFESN